MSYYEFKKQAALQEINVEIHKLVQNMEHLNTYLKDTMALGGQFQNISSIWNTFYDVDQQIKEVQKEFGGPGEDNGDDGDNDDEADGQEGEENDEKIERKTRIVGDNGEGDLDANNEGWNDKVNNGKGSKNEEGDSEKSGANEEAV